MGTMIKVLFICHGNICRSPMAACLLRALAEREGLSDRLEADSAAVTCEELGNPVYPPARRTLEGHGVPCDGHRARQLTASDYVAFDYLIGMDASNLRRMRSICGGDPDRRLSLLMDWTGRGGDVADPWYSGDFETAFRDIEAGCRAVLERLRPLLEQEDPLTAGGIRRAMGEAAAGLRIEALEKATSTNLLLRDRAEAGAPDGTVLTAETQTQGRGRRARRFFSPPGCGLYLSVLLRPSLPPEDAPLLTAAAAAAAAEAVEAVSGRAAQIKWVNDVLLDGRKVCGILTEGRVSAETGRFAYVVVGAGFNVCPPPGGFPPELAELAGTVLPEAADGARSRLAAEFLRRLRGYAARLEERTFLEPYRARSVVPGRRVTVYRTDGTQRAARALALDERCRLVVAYDDGSRETLDSGEVSLRMEGASYV